MEKKSDNEFLVQGSILAISSIVSRFIGMLYKIPMTNIIGDKGMGYYSSAYELYNIALIVSSYSIPTAVSKIVSAKVSRKENRDVMHIFKRSLVLAAVIGAIASLFVFAFAGTWGVITGDKSVAIPLRVLAPTIFVFSIMGVIRGYFQGHRTMIPTALSQLIEQIINAFVSVFAAYLLMKAHNAAVNSEAYGAAGGTLGSLAGALSGLVFLIFVYYINRSYFRRKALSDTSGSCQSIGEFIVVFFSTTIPIILSQTAYQASGIIDNTIFGTYMKSVGLNDDVYFYWGIYSNKYRMLTNLPVAIATALGTSIVPTLSACHAAGNIKECRQKIASGIKFNMIIAFPCAVGMAVLARPIILLLFPGTEIAVSSKILMIGAAAIVFFALSTLTNGVLQGIDRMIIPVVNAVLALAIHVFLVIIMLYYGKMSIYGLVIGNITYALTVCILNWFAIKRNAGYHQEILTTFIIPFAASGVMGICAYFTYMALIRLMGSSLVANGIATLFAVIVAVIVYTVVLVKLHGVSVEELYTFPKGASLVRLLKKCGLIRY